jgi:hypothetical protein
MRKAPPPKQPKQPVWPFPAQPLPAGIPPEPRHER